VGIREMVSLRPTLDELFKEAGRVISKDE